MQQAIAASILKKSANSSTEANIPKPPDSSSPKWTKKTFEITDETVPEHLLPPDYRNVPRLLHGLEGILSSKGVSSKDNYKSEIWNQRILSPGKIKFDNFASFSLPSEDELLLQVGKEMKARVITSTSSFTPLLSKLYYLLIHSISPNITYLEDDQISISFPAMIRRKYFPIGCKFNKLQTSADISTSSHQLHDESSPQTSESNQHHHHHHHKRDIPIIYTMDQIQIQQAGSNVLSFLGKSIEKMLTTKEDDFLLKFAHTSTHNEKDPEYYHYLKKGMFVCRSQLDCYGEMIGTFDIKSRAIKAVRSDLESYQIFYGFSPPTSTYKPPLFLHDPSLLKQEFGMMSWGALIKHNNQIRLGKMRGIFVAYHNTREFLGFEYISKEALDKLLFDGSVKGDKFYELLLKVAEICLQVCFTRTTSDQFSVLFYAMGNRFDFIIRDPKPLNPSSPLPPPPPPPPSSSTNDNDDDTTKASEQNKALEALRQLLSKNSNSNTTHQSLDAAYYCYSIQMEVFKNKERIIMPQFDCSDSDLIEANVMLKDETEFQSQNVLAKRYATIATELH